MHTSRHLDWDGCFNARDLGGLRASDGRMTRWGAVVRADALDGLTDGGLGGAGRPRGADGDRSAQPGRART